MQNGLSTLEMPILHRIEPFAKMLKWLTSVCAEVICFNFLFFTVQDSCCDHGS